MLIDVNYKTISFTRADGVDIGLKVDLKNPFDLEENFLVLSAAKFRNNKESNLFYWITIQRWTLNELIFFALNNNLCIRITDKQNNEITTYGVCGTDRRVFNHIFGNTFN
jgi:hypothetical protein